MSNPEVHIHVPAGRVSACRPAVSCLTGDLVSQQLRLDCASRLVARGDGQITLPPQEFALLATYALTYQHRDKSAPPPGPG